MVYGLTSPTRSVFEHISEISTHPMQKDSFENILNVVVAKCVSLVMLVLRFNLALVIRDQHDMKFEFF